MALLRQDSPETVRVAWFKGGLDEVKIFNKAYGINDIRRLMIGQNPR